VSSPYDVLGLDPDADERAVVRAYRRQVKNAHPDHGGSKEEFQAVKQAYERIRDGYEPVDTDDESPRRQPPDRERPAADETADDQRHVEYLNYEVLDDHGWGLDDEDLFDRASAAGLDEVDYGEFSVDPSDSLLEAAEDCGYAWPYACRGGACTNCAVAVIEGEMPTPTDHILPDDLLERGIRLSCTSAPVTDELKVVYNVKHLPGVDELRLPASRFEKARAND